MRPVSSLWCSERAGRVRTLAAWCGIRGKCPSSVGAAVSDPLPVWPASVGNEAGWGRCPTGLRHPGHSMLGAELLRCEVNRIRVSIRGFGEWCRAGEAARLPLQIAGLTGYRANAQRSYGGHVPRHVFHNVSSFSAMYRNGSMQRSTPTARGPSQLPRNCLRVMRNVVRKPVWLRCSIRVRHFPLRYERADGGPRVRPKRDCRGLRQLPGLREQIACRGDDPSPCRRKSGRSGVARMKIYVSVWSPVIYDRPSAR